MRSLRVAISIKLDDWTSDMNVDALSSACRSFYGL